MLMMEDDSTDDVQQTIKNSIVISGCWRHLDGISTLALAGGSPLGQCRLN